MALAPGSRLGSYDVTALIGQGGMGKVRHVYLGNTRHHARPHAQLMLNGGYRSVTSKKAYAFTRRPHLPTPTTKSNNPFG